MKSLGLLLSIPPLGTMLDNIEKAKEELLWRSVEIKHPHLHTYTHTQRTRIKRVKDHEDKGLQGRSLLHILCLFFLNT